MTGAAELFRKVRQPSDEAQFVHENEAAPAAYTTAPDMTATIASDLTARNATRRPWFAALLAVLLLVTVTACSGGGDGDSDSSGIEEPTFQYVIPVGSGEKIAQGEPLDILPRQLDAKVGETIMIRNEDTIAHSLGPWFVGPGEVLRQRFLTVGVYEGTCSVHPDGAFTVNVQEA